MQKEIKGFFNEYRWLSNFWPAPLKINGITYKNSEAAYQSFKFPADQRAQFSNLNPDEAKKLGKNAKIDQKEWNRTKMFIMILVVSSKFSQNPDLKQKLKETGDAYLEETNDWNDTCWGVCNGVGSNNLGKILMAYRQYLC